MTRLRSLAVRWLACGLLALGLSACKVELHTGLSETESNDMVALLLSHNLDAVKGSATKEGVPLLVESADLAEAIEVLRENGYPRDSFQGIGQVFQGQGLISSPLEERVRFIYALSQSISETLSQIDGVITARVHVIVPEQHPLDDKPEGSSASVFLKTRPGINLEDKIPDIKLLVQNSVEGLIYDDVVVALFEMQPSKRIRTDGPPLQTIAGIRFTADSEDRLMIAGGAVAGVVLLLLLGNLLLYRQLRRSRSGTELAAARSDA